MPVGERLIDLPALLGEDRERRLAHSEAGDDVVHLIGEVSGLVLAEALLAVRQIPHGVRVDALDLGLRVFLLLWVQEPASAGRAHVGNRLRPALLGKPDRIDHLSVLVRDALEPVVLGSLIPQAPRDVGGLVAVLLLRLGRKGRVARALRHRGGLIDARPLVEVGLEVLRVLLSPKALDLLLARGLVGQSGIAGPAGLG